MLRVGSLLAVSVKCAAVHSSATYKLISLSARHVNKFVLKWSLKIPPHFMHVATLPCEIFVIFLTHLPVFWCRPELQ